MNKLCKKQNQKKPPKKQQQQLFVAFPWVETSTGPGGFMIYYMTGTPEGSTENGFMEKPGIEPAIVNRIIGEHKR